MSTAPPRQLLMLADHAKLSILERQRAISLNLDTEKQDKLIPRTLTGLKNCLKQYEDRLRNEGLVVDEASEATRIRRQYNDLYAQFYGEAPVSSELTQPNDPTLQGDFDAAQTTPASAQRKNVRFRDNPDDEAADAANRAALFSEQERYRDDPPPPDQSQLDNQQIHAYHKQVLQDQDDQLEVLGQSIGRQRLIGIQMGNEIDEQNELLTDVESGVDRHQSTLDRAQKRLTVFAKKSKQNWSWITIAILIIVLLLLIIVLK